MTSATSDSPANLVRSTPRSTVRRFAARGTYDREVLNSILDECLIAHVGFSHEGQPAVLPMAFWRSGDYVYFHGAAQNRLMMDLLNEGQCCFVVNTLDALILAKAAMHHSVNYRSVIIYGKPEEVTEQPAKLNALHSFIERVYPGRWETIRAPSDAEMALMRVMRLKIDEASAKVHAAPPTSLAHDAHVNAWTGVVPVRTSAGTPIPKGMEEGVPVPEHVLNLGRNWDASFFQRFPSEEAGSFNS
jgi:uncharacterized protein